MTDKKPEKTLDQKVDALLVLVMELVKGNVEIKEVQEEILEKLANINVSGSGYGYEAFGD